MVNTYIEGKVSNSRTKKNERDIKREYIPKREENDEYNGIFVNGRYISSNDTNPDSIFMNIFPKSVKLAEIQKDELNFEEYLKFEWQNPLVFAGQIDYRQLMPEKVPWQD